MNIVYAQEKLIINFVELEDGEIFSDEDACIYLKIPTVIDEKYHRAVNAIDLEDSSLTFFDEGDRIKIIDYELVIKN